MSRKLLKIEKYLILVPATVILVPGLLYMLLVPLGSMPSPQSPNYNQKLSQLVIFEALSLLSAAALFSLWLAMERYLNEDSVLSYSRNPYIYAGVIAGIIISMAALLEYLFPNHYIKQLLGVRENTAFLSMYIFGLPLYIPALHLLISGRLEDANQSLKSGTPRSGAP